MKKIILILTFLLPSLTLLANNPNNLSLHYYDAFTTNTPLKTLAEQNINLSINEAYKTQQQWVKKATETTPIIGFKSYLTNPSEQKKLNINTPIFSTLLTKNQYSNFDIIQLQSISTYKLSTNIGITFKKAITQPISSTYILKNLIRHSTFYVELTKNRFPKNTTLEYNDIILSNTNTDSIIKGSKLKTYRFNPIQLTIAHNNLPIFEQTITIDNDTFLNNLLWLVNKTIELGWEITPQHILLTETLHNQLPLKTGRYTINLDPYSAFLFEIK